MPGLSRDDGQVGPTGATAVTGTLITLGGDGDRAFLTNKVYFTGAHDSIIN